MVRVDVKEVVVKWAISVLTVQCTVGLKGLSNKVQNLLWASLDSSRNLKSFGTPQTYFQLSLNLRRDSHREHDPLLPGELVDTGSVAAAVVAGVGRVVVGDDVARVALVLDAVDAWRRRRHAAVAHSASFAPGRQQPKN